MTSGLETEWDYSGRKGRDGQKKKIGKAKERKEKVKGKRWGNKWTRVEEGCTSPTRANILMYTAQQMFYECAL